MKKVIIIFVLTAMVFAMTGCGQVMKTPADAPEFDNDYKPENTFEVYNITNVSVKISDDNGNVIFDSDVELYNDNTTVIDALTSACESIGCTVEYGRDRGNTAIDFLYEGAVIGSSRNVFYQGSAEWYYYVNGERYIDPELCADTYFLADGDSLEWIYYVQSDINEAVFNQPENSFRIEPELPNMDFNGRDFVFLVEQLDGNRADICASELTGDVINDSTFRTSRFVEERYNVRIKQEITPDGSKFRKVVMSAEPYYSAFIPRLSACPFLASEGLLQDLKRVPYHDFTKPWWQMNAADNLMFGDEVYFMTGDIVFQNYNAVSAVFFSKELTMNYGLESEYDLVMNGLWTIDKLMEMGKHAPVDLNGNGMMDMEDQYGLIADSNSPAAFYLGSAELLFNNPGDPVAAFVNTNSQMVWSKVFNMLHDLSFTLNAPHYIANGNASTEYINKAFTDNRALFFCTELGYAPYLRAAAQWGDFGILPVPKYDLPQMYYRSAINADRAYAAAIPLTNEDLNTAGVILEALSAESFNNNLPALYDTYLCGKFSRDDESAVMLDIIRANIVYDVGSVCNFGSINDALKQTMLENNPDIMQIYERLGGKIEASANKYAVNMGRLKE